MKHILIVSSQPADLRKIRPAFENPGAIEQVGDTAAAITKLSKKRYDLVFVDIELLSGGDRNAVYHDAIAALKQNFPGIDIVVITSPRNIREAVQAVKAGASDYVTAPLDPEEVRHVADCISAHAINQSELDYLRKRFWKVEVKDMVQTGNGAMQAVYQKIQAVAPTKTTVLLHGETGTGKGVLASLIHRHSNRDEGRFISVHCGAIPDTLLESELFGYEKGAFTGAMKRKLGKFEIAKRGTLFLDEIGTVTPSAQIKLLQVLQDGSFSRVGGEDSLYTDARVIAATNSDLRQMSADGAFRRDLYYRLNVFPIIIPPLRERPEDIPLLVDMFLNRLNSRMQKQIRAVHPEVVAAMKTYAWPGNIRELENILERAFILESTDILTPENFPFELFPDQTTAAVVAVDPGDSLQEARKKAVDEFERQYIKKLLAKNRGRINKSADDAGISTRQLHKLMARYGIHKEEFKDDRLLAIRTASS